MLAYVASGALHGLIAIAAAVGISSPFDDHATLSGKQNVMHLQLSASTPTVASEAVVTLAKLEPPPELPNEEPELRDLQVEPIDKAEETDPESFERREAPLVFDSSLVHAQPVALHRPPPKPEEPKPPEVERPIARQAMAQVPLPPQMVVVPELAGTDESEPPDLQGNQPPSYPELALQRGWHGTVWLRLQIDVQGKIVKVEIERSSGYDILDHEAMRAVSQWKAQPAKRRGKPVETVEILPVRFVQ